MATDNPTPAEIPSTVRVATVRLDGYHVDLGEDADGRFTFAVLRREGHPACWCFGHPACLALANMVGDKPFLSRLPSNEANSLIDIMQTAFCAIVVSDAQDASLRAQHYPHPLRAAIRDALRAAFCAGTAFADYYEHETDTDQPGPPDLDEATDALLAAIPLEVLR